MVDRNRIIRTESLRQPNGLKTSHPLNPERKTQAPIGVVGERLLPIPNDGHIFKVVSAFGTSYFDGEIQAITYVNSELTVLPEFVMTANPATIPVVTTDGWGVGYNIYTGAYAWLANFTNLMSGGSDIPLNGLCFAPARVPLLDINGLASPFDVRIAVGVY